MCKRVVTVGWKMVHHPQGRVNDFELCQNWKVRIYLFFLSHLFCDSTEQWNPKCKRVLFLFNTKSCLHTWFIVQLKSQHPHFIFYSLNKLLSECRYHMVKIQSLRLFSVGHNGINKMQCFTNPLLFSCPYQMPSGYPCGLGVLKTLILW